MQPGQYVQTGTRLLALVPLDSAYVEANFKETQIDRLKPGQKVTIKPDAFSARAIVKASSRASRRPRAPSSRMLPPENATGNFTKIVQRVPVRITVPPEVARRRHPAARPVGRGRGAHPRRQRCRRPRCWARSGSTRFAAKLTARGPTDATLGAAAMAVAQQRFRPARRRAHRRGARRAEPSARQARRHVTFIAMVFGMFMAILDIQIVSASLAEIQAGLSASSDEVAWVQTSYLIAEVIMIPLSGILSRAFSTRYLFALSCAGFTLMSFMCSTATDINQMIVWRALQGFIGGGMIPTVFAAAFTIFPREKQPIIAPLIGLVATLAPTIGPTVGGYLTDLFSWHWLFLVNVVPGIVVTLADLFLIDFDKPDWSLLDKFDWIGPRRHGGVPRRRSNTCWRKGRRRTGSTRTSSSSAPSSRSSAAVLFFWRAFTAKQPIVDLTAFANRNFAFGSLFSFVMGIGLYGLTYLYPVYLARVRGYSSLQIGETMFVTGAVHVRRRADRRPADGQGRPAHA